MQKGGQCPLFIPLSYFFLTGRSQPSILRCLLHAIASSAAPTSLEMIEPAPTVAPAQGVKCFKCLLRKFVLIVKKCYIHIKHEVINSSVIGTHWHSLQIWLYRPDRRIGNINIVYTI